MSCDDDTFAHCDLGEECIKNSNFKYDLVVFETSDVSHVAKLGKERIAIGTASANSAKFRGIRVRPRMYIVDLI